MAKPIPRILTVKDSWHLTPNMIRVTFAGEELDGVPPGREGANCKIMLPEPGETRTSFEARFVDGPVPARRTYTVRYHRPQELELDIDFVDHGDLGPASAWARAAKPGSFLGFAGPGTVKVPEFYADFYLIAADMSALPVAAATLEAMPKDARGLALFEITSPEDVQDIEMPPGIEVRWMLHPEPHRASTAMIDAIREMDWPEGSVQTCIAGEHSSVRALRSFLIGEKGLAKKDAYISGYWKIGLIEDQHQELKRSEVA